MQRWARWSRMCSGRCVLYGTTRHSTGLTPEKIALLGGSAGGYLSNMAGVLAPTANPASFDPVERESDRVQAVVTLYGLSDLGSMPPIAVTYLTLMLGGANRDHPDEALRAGSPITHVSAQAPPFLLIHGDRDQAVPFAQSTRFERALRSAGARAELITIPGGQHATGLWHTIPGVPDWERQMTVWLNATLGHTGEVGAGIVLRVRAGATVSR